MAERVAERISQWCALSLSLSREERQVIRYGLEIWMDGIMKCLLLVGAGYVLGRPVEFMAALFFFCSLRYWAGGYHCATNIGCVALMFGMCFCSAFIGDFFVVFPLSLFAVGCFFLWGIAYLYAPCNSKANPITDGELLRKKRRGTFWWMALEGAVILCCDRPRWQWVFFVPVIIETCTILPVWGKYKRRR